MADWSDLIGKPLEVAKTRAQTYGHTLRVTEWNGQPAVATRDYVDDRINVSVERDPNVVEALWIVSKINGRG